jgi:hypothetical protein
MRLDDQARRDIAVLISHYQEADVVGLVGREFRKTAHTAKISLVEAAPTPVQ